MKIFTSILIASLLMVAPANAKFYKLANLQKSNVAVGLYKDAEFVAANLTIENDDRDPIKRIQFWKKAKQALEKKTDELKYASIVLLPVNLDVDRSYKIFSTDKTSLTYRLLVSLPEHNNDFFEATAAIRNIVDGLPEYEDTKYSLSNAFLGIENPEQYRNKILDMIDQDIRNLKQRFGERLKLKISGLNSPVEIYQLDDIKVLLCINYLIELIEE